MLPHDDSELQVNEFFLDFGIPGEKQIRILPTKTLFPLHLEHKIEVENPCPICRDAQKDYDATIEEIKRLKDRIEMLAWHHQELIDGLIRDLQELPANVFLVKMEQLVEDLK